MKNYENINLKDTARILKALSNLIEKSNPEEISALIRGNASLAILPKESVENKNSRVLIDIDTIAKNLETIETREAGADFLKNSSLSRRDLERLARFLNVLVLKTDNIDRLTDKIIESSIGAKLNSVAIRGRDIDS